MTTNPARIALVYLEPMAADLTSAQSAVLEVAALARHLEASAVVVAVDPQLGSGRFRLELADTVRLILVQPAWSGGRDLYGPRLVAHVRRIRAVVGEAAKGADAILVFDADVPSLAAASAIQRAGVRLGVYLRGERGYDRSVRRPGPIPGLALRLLERIIRWATRRWMRGAIVLESSPGLADRVGASGVTISWSPTYLETLPSVPTRQGYPPLRVLCVGRMAVEKRIHDMITAVELAARRGLDIRLTIAGDGPMMAEIRRRVDRSEIADQVELPGFVAPGPGLDALYRESAVFLVLSETEGRPKSVIEALSWGLAVVWTPVGGLPELLGTAQASLRVSIGRPDEVADVLCRLAAAPDELRAASRSARDLAATLLIGSQAAVARSLLVGQAPPP